MQVDEFDAEFDNFVCQSLFNNLNNLELFVRTYTNFWTNGTQDRCYSGKHISFIKDNIKIIKCSV